MPMAPMPSRSVTTNRPMTLPGLAGGFGRAEPVAKSPARTSRQCSHSSACATMASWRSGAAVAARTS